MSNAYRVATVKGFSVQNYTHDREKGKYYLPDGRTFADIEIWIDTEALANAIGAKAIHSKKKLSKLQAGAVIVKAINVRKVAQS